MHITWRNCFKIGLSILILYLCISYSHNLINFLGVIIATSTPLFIGGAIAYVVNIFMSFYERHFFTRTSNKIVKKLRIPLCMFLGYATIIAAVVIILSLIVPQLISCIELILEKIPPIINYFVKKVEKLNIVPEDILDFLSDTNLDWEKYAADILTVIASGAGSVFDIIFKMISSIINGVITAFVSIIFSVYLLLSKRRLISQINRTMKRYLPQKAVRKTNYVFHTLNVSFHRYIVAQCTEALILGILCTIGMYIINLPYATMIGALVGFTAVVPIVGAFIGAGIGAFMILTVSPAQSLVFLIFIVVLQQLEENLIYPRVVGSSVNLPGIWVLAAIIIGGGVMGVFGMFISVPIVATIYHIVRNDVSKHESDEVK